MFTSAVRGATVKVGPTTGSNVVTDMKRYSGMLVSSERGGGGG